MTINDTCPDCGCGGGLHYGTCPQIPALQAAASDRARKFDAMKRGTVPNADQTTIYGIDLATMDADEIRIAAYWLASQLEKKS